MTEMRNTQNILVGNVKGRDCFGDLGIDLSIIFIR